MPFAFWNTLSRILWAVAAGMIAGLLFGAEGQRFWMALGAVAILAIGASLAALGKRPQRDGGSLSDTHPNLLELQPLARDILEQLPDPLMLVDASGRVILANRAMRSVVGVHADRKHVSALLRTPPVLEAIRRTTETGESAAIEFNSPVPVQRHYRAHVARSGAERTVTILLLHDLTAMKRAEQMRADFVANASHELRTPLAALSGFIDTLRGHAKDDLAAREQFLDIMSVEADRMRRLIDDLLSLTRIEQNEHVPPAGAVALEPVLREAIAALTPLARSDGIALELEAEPDLPPATGERDELVQVFQNLIHNAIKYGKPGGHVWVELGLGRLPRARRSEQMLVASVRDDGEGIPPDAVPRLTERFYRVDVKRSREKGGTGLGLAIVKHIVNRHLGRLTVESRLGEGSKFTVFLPASDGVRAGASASVTEMS